MTTQRTMELAVAVAAFIFGAVVAIDSRRLGASWSDDGPQAGYFPFYIGLIICLASARIFYSHWRRHGAEGEPFLMHGQLRQILALLVPAVFYVAVIPYAGIYVASAALIGYFMARHGDHRLWTTTAVAAGVPVALFLMFEVWFRTPLPKGPLEAWLHLL